MNNIIYNLNVCITGDNLFVDISKRVKNVSILSDYNEYLFPVIQLNMMLSVEEYRHISERLDLKVIMSIKMGNEANDTYSYIMKDVVFKIMNEDNYYLQQSNEPNNMELEKSNLLSYKAILIQEENLNVNKENVYGNFIDVDLGKMVNFLTEKLNFQDKENIIEPPSNKKVFEQILLPYSTVLKTYKYLDKVYGIYENGLKLFFDIDKNYILNTNKNTVKEKKDIMISIQNTNDYLKQTVLPDTINIIPTDLTYVNLDRLKSEVVGTNNLMILNSDGTTLMNNKFTKDIDKGTDKSKVYYQKYANPFLKNTINPDNDTLITIKAQNIDYTKINFLNEFTIIDQLKRFNDYKFAILKYTHTFVNTQNNCFDLYTVMNLKKI